MRDPDEAIQVDLFYPKRPDEPTKRYQAQRARLVVDEQSLTEVPTANLEMDEVKLIFSNSSKPSHLDSADVPAVIVPTKFVRQAERYLFTDFLRATAVPGENP